MASDRVRILVRALLLVVTGAAGALAWSHDLYATAWLALLAAIWLAALGLNETTRPALLPPPPIPPSPRQEDHRRLTAYLDLSPAPLVALEPEGRLRVVNRAARRLLAAEDIVADPPASLIAALAGTRPGRTGRIELAGPSETHSFALATGDLAIAGRMTRIGALIDIDAALKAAEATALRELVQVLSHEIVNALTPIASLADTACAMLDDPVPPLHNIREAIGTVSRRAASLHRFGESYRALAKLPAPVPGRIPVPGFVEDIERLFAIRWPHIARTIDLREAPAYVLADADQLTAALWAVLQNAAEALMSCPEPHVTLEIRGLIDRTTITVADTGPGISEADGADIFRPFFTTKAEGTGIGLALARQILRGHGGDLALVPSLRGACFEMSLPSLATQSV